MLLWQRTKRRKNHHQEEGDEITLIYLFYDISCVFMYKISEKIYEQISK